MKHIEVNNAICHNQRKLFQLGINRGMTTLTETTQETVGYLFSTFMNIYKITSILQSSNLSNVSTSTKGKVSIFCSITSQTVYNGGSETNLWLKFKKKIMGKWTHRLISSASNASSRESFNEFLWGIPPGVQRKFLQESPRNFFQSSSEIFQEIHQKCFKKFFGNSPTSYSGIPTKVLRYLSRSSLGSLAEAS